MPATVTYNATTRIATLTPSAALAASATYEATVKTTTAFQAPSANAAVTSSAGDNNGFQTNPTSAYANDGLFAVDTNSGTSTSTSCTDTGKDKHIYRNYGFSLPSGVTLRGIEVRLDARVDSSSNSPTMCVQISRDGGVTWTAAKRTATLTTTEATYILGSASDTWGLTWAPGDFSDTNFGVRGHQHGLVHGPRLFAGLGSRAGDIPKLVSQDLRRGSTCRVDNAHPTL